MKRKKHHGLLKKSLAITLALGTSTMFSMAQAEEETPSYNLDTVVVTATKIEQTIKDIPVSVTVITAEDIEKMNVQTVDQALRLASGVYATRNKGLTNTTAAISLRGFSGQGQTLVLLDGQPLNQAYAGAVNWSSIPIQSIERIEVVKGSNSALYGSQAMGGVINIITKNPQTQEIRLSVKYESYNTWTEQLDVSDKVSAKFSYHLGYERKTSDGYIADLKTVTSLPAGTTGGTPTTDSKGNPVYIVGDKGKNTWDENILHGKFVYSIDDQRNVSLGIQHDKYEYGYGEGHNYLGNYTPSYNTFLGLPGGRETNVYTLGYKDKGTGLTVNIGLTDVVSNWYISSVANNQTGVISETPSRRWNVDVQKELQITEKDRMVAGVNYRNDWIHNQEYNLSNWLTRTKTTLRVEAEGRAKTKGVFMQDEHRFNDKWSLTFGGRYDAWDNQDETHAGNDRDASAFSPKIGVTYKQNASSQVYLSAGKAFNAPDMYKMYRTWVNGSTTYLGNPDLKSEKVSSVELGWKKSFSENTNFNISYFHNETKNMIFYENIAANIKQYRNAEEGRTDGVELELSHRLNSSWTSFLNYTYQHAVISEYAAKPQIEGKQVSGVPKQMFNIGFDYQKNKLRGSLFGSYVSKRYSSDDESDVVNGVPTSYDPYFIVNANLAYQWDKNSSVTFGVNNLFNREYFSYYVAPGRTYSFQLTRKF